jgi:hypothetical protein
MDDVIGHLWENFGGRVGGPLTFRLILQPMVASFLAIRAGLVDARMGKPPYFWTILTNPDDRAALLREGWTAVAKVFALATIIDLVYQWIVFRWMFPLEALFVAFLLACVPYLLIRGPANRLATTRRQRRQV